MLDPWRRSENAARILALCIGAVVKAAAAQIGEIAASCAYYSFRRRRVPFLCAAARVNVRSRVLKAA